MNKKQRGNPLKGVQIDSANRTNVRQSGGSVSVVRKGGQQCNCNSLIYHS